MKVVTGGELHQLLAGNKPPTDAAARVQLAAILHFAAHQLYKESARLEVDALRDENSTLRKENAFLRQELADWESGVRQFTE